MNDVKTIVIAGGSGFLGKALIDYFYAQGHEVILLSRSENEYANTVLWDGKTVGEWITAIDGADVLINLSGKSVDCRYTPKNKKAILSSRIDSTRILGKAIEQAENPPSVWLNASTATIYVHSETQLNTEENGIIGDDFSMNIAKQWEQAFFSFTLPNTRQVALRTSIVLGNTGGAFPKMKQITKLGLGGKQGSGEQFISWIHIDDFCKSVEFLIEQPIEGAINITAPKPVRNQAFTQLLSKTVKTPIVLSQPVWLLEIGSIFKQTETELLLKSRNVYPQRLIESGFTFKYKKVEEAIEDLLHA